MGTRVERIEMGELSAWRLHGRHAELLVCQQGAQVLEYREHGQQPLIWLSEQARAQRGRSLRGGIPVCWPWFGELARNPAAVRAMHQAGMPAPAHGLVRGLDWQLRDIHSDEAQIRLVFDAPTQPLPGWPMAPALSLELCLGEHLQLSLVNHNRSSVPLAVSQALHSYFAVSDVRRISIEGLHGCPYLETLEDWQPRRQEEPLQISGETDRVYQDVPAQLCIHDPLWQRRIHLHTRGSASAVLWNPGSDKAARLSQFAADAWQRMLCIETANLLEDALLLPPGARHRLELELWSSAL